MVNLKIDHNEISVPEGTTIMEAAALAGIDIPKLCYLKDINEIAACRVCLVEVVGKEKLVTSCNNKVQEGLEILTNSPKVRVARKPVSYTHLFLSVLAPMVMSTASYSLRSS